MKQQNDASAKQRAGRLRAFGRWAAPELGKAVITGAVTVGFAAVVALAITPWIQDRLQPPTCDDPKRLHLVSRSELTAEGRFNPPEQGATYEPARAIDGDSSTAWVEGNDEADPTTKYGEGQSLTITLAEPRDVQLVCVINGYAKTEQLYLDNARIRQLTVSTDNGQIDSVLPEKPLEFYAAYQPVAIRAGTTTELVLTIGTARAGQTQSQQTDTAISEVEIWAGDDPAK